MKLRDFQLPTKIDWLELEDNYGKLSSEPFEKGYGHTIGNSLRRILLSSMVGAAITSVKIEGVPHEYGSIEGVKEDVLEIIFNLKQLRFKMFVDEPQRITLSAEGAGEVKAADFDLGESVKIINADEHIATLSDKSNIKIEATIEKGRGYLPVAERQEEVTEVDEIPIDASFSPIKKVNYEVEIARVGQAMDYDRLILEVWSDGSIKPPEAVAYAAQILQKTTEAFSVPGMEVELGDTGSVQQARREEMLELPVQEVKLSTRLENLLSSAKVKTIGDLMDKSIEDIENISGLGDKYMDELEEKLDKFNKEREVELKLSAAGEEE